MNTFKCIFKTHENIGSTLLDILHIEFSLFLLEYQNLLSNLHF